MSRGGRGGRRGGGPRNPWDDSDVAPDNKPMELFPPYWPKLPRPLTEKERRINFIQEQLERNDKLSPLYTGSRDNMALLRGEKPQDKPYRVEDPANVNAFTVNKSWSERHLKPSRRLPDLSRWKFYPELVPPELHKYIQDPVDAEEAGGPPKKKRKYVPRSLREWPAGQPEPDPPSDNDVRDSDEEAPMTMASQLARRKAMDEANLQVEEDDAGEPVEDFDKLVERMAKAEEAGEALSDDEEEEEDEVYEDDSDGDYNAERAFDGGDNDDDDGGGDEGAFYT